MDKYFEVLEKAKGSVALNINEQLGFDSTADTLEKGRAAQMGEMRIWNGVKYQKTPQGWIPVKGEKQPFKSEEKKEIEGENKFFDKKEMTLDQQDFVDECFNIEGWISSAKRDLGTDMKMEDFIKWVKLNDNPSRFVVKEISEKFGVDEAGAKKIYEDRREEFFEKVREDDRKSKERFGGLAPEYAVRGAYRGEKANRISSKMMSEIQEFKKPRSLSAEEWTNVKSILNEAAKEVGHDKAHYTISDDIYGWMESKAGTEYANNLYEALDSKVEEATKIDKQFLRLVKKILKEY